MNGRTQSTRDWNLVSIATAPRAVDSSPSWSPIRSTGGPEVTSQASAYATQLARSMGIQILSARI